MFAEWGLVRKVAMAVSLLCCSVLLSVSPLFVTGLSEYLFTITHECTQLYKAMKFVVSRKTRPVYICFFMPEGSYSVANLERLFISFRAISYHFNLEWLFISFRMDMWRVLLHDCSSFRCNTVTLAAFVMT